VTPRVHGYRVGDDLLSWGAGEWANVEWGSIYHALRDALRRPGHRPDMLGTALALLPALGREEALSCCGSDWRRARRCGTGRPRGGWAEPCR
jgi:hypothetical protein